MAENRLNIIHLPDENTLKKNHQPTQDIRSNERKAKFERLWLIDPKQFDPLSSCIESLRLDRTWLLLNKYASLKEKPQTLDIGCGEGVFSRKLRDAGARVTAIDISENALKKFKQSGADDIQLKQKAMPQTDLPGGIFNIIICTELIADIAPEDYRLFFAELSRLIERNGYLVFSTSIDINSDGAVERLKELAESEFDIIEAIASYHAFYLRLKNYTSIPSRFIQGWENQECKKKELLHLDGLTRLWYLLNTSPCLIWLWYACHYFSKPIENILRHKRKVLLFLEKMSRFISDKQGVSHYLFIAKLRSFQ